MTAPVKEVGTLAEIGAQVGDVVVNNQYRSITYFVCRDDVGLYACKHQSGIRLHGWNSTTWGWRIIRRDSDANPAGPVITATVKRIVPGVYGRVSVHELGVNDGKCVHLALVMDDLHKRGTVHAMMNAAEIRAAIATLTEIADALEGGEK